jgi:DNA-binding MarR family transcriptional regulator
MDYEKMAQEFFSNRPNRPIHLPRFESILSQGEFLTLICLREKKAGALSGELCSDMNLSSGRTSIILNGLEKKKMIRRVKDEEDKRKVRVYITETGSSFIEKKQQAAIKQLSSFLEYIGEEDSADLNRIMKKFNQWSKEKGEDICCN